MLRINTEKTGDIVTLRLEGKLVQPWIDELIQAWIDLGKADSHDQTVQIDLNAVSFVDTQGRAILACLRRLGCRLTGSGPFIAAVIEEVSTDRTL